MLTSSYMYLAWSRNNANALCKEQFLPKKNRVHMLNCVLVQCRPIPEISNMRSSLAFLASCKDNKTKRFKCRLGIIVAFNPVNCHEFFFCTSTLQRSLI